MSSNPNQLKLVEIPIQIIDPILQSKRHDSEEFFINLFELCNLRCSFCWQDHDSTEGMDTIQQNCQSVISTIDKSNLNKFDINIMGGELFFDDIPDSMFDEYKQFARSIHQHCEETGKHCKLNWVTNLVYDNIFRVIDFVQCLKNEGMDTFLTTSYDPTGRFNKQTLKTFETNLTIAKRCVKSISIVLTKPNIKSILKDNDPVLKRLYANFDMFVDYYSPERNAEKMAPSDEELLQTFYFLIDNYPEIAPISDWLQSNSNKMSCRSSNVIMPNGEAGKCRKLLHKESYDKFESPIDFYDNKTMEKTFIEKRNCITCEYFDRCGMGCFLHSDFIPRPTIPECIFKLTYDYITKGIKLDGFR